MQNEENPPQPLPPPPPPPPAPMPGPTAGVPPLQPLGYHAPVPAASPRPNFYQQAAKASWVAPVVALVLGCLTRGSSERSPMTGGIVGLINVAMTFTGLVMGIVALFGVRKYGSRGILAPAIVGLVLNGLLVGSLIAVILIVIRSA